MSKKAVVKNSIKAESQAPVDTARKTRSETFRQGFLKILQASDLKQVGEKASVFKFGWERFWITVTKGGYSSICRGTGFKPSINHVAYVTVEEEEAKANSWGRVKSKLNMNCTLEECCEGLKFMIDDCKEAFEDHQKKYLKNLESEKKRVEKTID